jgi:nitrate/TMAO reductase-like tetraheme cytochrome c subunit
MMDLTQEIPQSLPDPPLPGGVAALFRWFFQVPQWIQIGGVILAALVAAVFVTIVWKRRTAIGTWLRTRPAGAKAILVIVLLTFATVAGVVGQQAWHYTQHENDFCQACHVMDQAYARFAQSEHAKRECHDCHQQPISASLRQVWLWVLDRPQEIGSHAPVPNSVCIKCHITEDPDSTWQRISATAGHRVHLESDSSVLRNVQCVKCHGVEVHRFVPADQTCGQSGCHSTEDTQIKLGNMAAANTSFHCLACHQFTAPVNETVALDTARHGLVPTARGCLGCHDMQRILATYDPQEDPHKGVCGDCHNPHTQTEPRAAFQTCTVAGCHADPQTLSGFHRGINHNVVADCLRCHKPHVWTAPVECVACHPTLR